MAEVTNFQIGGLNLYTNPLIHSYSAQALSTDGQLIRAVNVDSVPFGAKIKRPGYGTYVAGSAPNAGAAVDLFSWTLDNGTQLYTYLNANGTLYYSTQGTGAWTVCGNGTLTAGSHVGRAVLNNTLVISQNAGTTRHTTNGTSFSDTSGAPAGGFLEQFQNRVYITGTNSTLTYSVTGDPTNWQTTGTSDSSSLTIPGAGKPNKLFKLANRLMISKEYQQLFRWDGFTLLDMATNLGLSSPFSYGTAEDTGFWLNRLGVITSDGNQPTMISNAIQRQIYNDAGSAIAGTSFGSAVGEVYRYDWFCAVGSTTDDFTYETVPNAILKYNFQKNEFLNYTFANFPTTMHAYKDATGSQQLIFGDSTGQTYNFGGTALNDNGQPIEAIMEFVFNFNVPHLQKEWRTFWAFFNPGCEATIMYALGDTFLKEEKVWIPMGQAVGGLVRYKFTAGQARSRLLYIKIIESSRNSRFSYYGCAINANIIQAH